MVGKTQWDGGKVFGEELRYDRMEGGVLSEMREAT